MDNIEATYNQYKMVRQQKGRKYLSFELWKQEYLTDVDLQRLATAN